MANINSFTETVNMLISQVNIALNNVVSLNESLTTKNDTVTISVDEVDPITGDSSTVTYAIPSYATTLNKVNAISQTVDTFVKGEGVILLEDGTYRQVSTMPVAIAPAQITGVSTPTQFNIKNNWFFPSLMFPQLTVSFDLTDKIDDTANKVVIRRVVVDNPTDTDTQWFLDNIVGTDRNYYDTVTFLSQQGRRYWEDDETIDLPLATPPYSGYFVILNKQTISGEEWYYLDTMYYGKTSDSPVIKNHQLSVGDFLRYNNSVWKIDDIQINEKRVHLIPYVGMDSPTVNNTFDIYTPPFTSKIVDLAVGYNECDIIFIKGVNDYFDLIGDVWSDGISFYTNYLTLSGGTQTFEDYYNTYVSDFGIQLEGQAKEKFIPAYFGVNPDAPIISTDMFSVNQINTQINSTLDTDSIKNTQTQIESTKTIINSLQTTIAAEKSQLVQLTDAGQRADLNAKITANINSLSTQTIQYDSLVKSLSTLAYQNSAVASDPKYRVRGFFPIPSPKGVPPQQIIQFEYAYRYLKLDNTGISLDTYQYTDPSTGQVVRGVFTDWTIVPTSIKTKVYDSSTETYTWVAENIADGEIININQVDIPIQNGENVELKVRSISEAGWPLNPLKSDWSNTVIVGFPANLAGSNQVTNILNDAVAQESAIQMQQTLDSAGVTTHLQDSIPNPNSGNGTYFKHQAVNLAFDLKTKNKGGIVTSVNTTDLQSQLEGITLNTFITVTANPSSTQKTLYPSITGTIQQFFQSIINTDPSIYDQFVADLTEI